MIIIVTQSIVILNIKGSNNNLKKKLAIMNDFYSLNHGIKLLIHAYKKYQKYKIYNRITNEYKKKSEENFDDFKDNFDESPEDNYKKEAYQNALHSLIYSIHGLTIITISTKHILKLTKNIA